MKLNLGALLGSAKKTAFPAIVYGWYLGYPKCCIASFIATRFVDVPRSEEFPLKGTGYVPCPVCAATFTDEELVARITQARKAEAPFPIPSEQYDDPKVFPHHTKIMAAQIKAGSLELWQFGRDVIDLFIDMLQAQAETENDEVLKDASH